MATVISEVDGFDVWIDEDDLHVLSEWNWGARPTAHGIYIIAKFPGNRTVSLNRFLLGEPEGLYADHKDRHPLNNSRANLRAVTPQESAYNRSGSRPRNSPYKGIWFQPRNAIRQWCAQIIVAGRKIHIGSYLTPIEAARAYDAKALELHGAFAVTNETLGLYKKEAA